MDMTTDMQPATGGVKLVKETAIFGQLPVGAVFQGKARPGMNKQDARIRAYKMLKREHPKENPMEWKADPPATAQ